MGARFLNRIRKITWFHGCSCSYALCQQFDAPFRNAHRNKEEEEKKTACNYDQAIALMKQTGTHNTKER